MEPAQIVFAIEKSRKKINDLSIITILNCQLIGDYHFGLYLSEFFMDFTNVERICITKTSLCNLIKNFPLAFGFIQSMKAIEIEIRECNLKGQTLKHIADSLIHLPNLKKITI